MALLDRLTPYCEALSKGIDTKNWHLSLMAAVTLPDICTSLEGKKSVQGEPGKHYIDWFNTYVTDYQQTVHRRKGVGEAHTVQEYLAVINKPYTLEDIEEHHLVFFTGVLSYALRCAIVHNGDGEVAKQWVTKKPFHQDSILGIQKVMFDTDTPDLIFQQRGTIGILNPKVYCESILIGVEKWIEVNQENPLVITRASDMLVFE